MRQYAKQEGRNGNQTKSLYKIFQPWGQHVLKESESEVLIAVHGNGGANHGKPKKGQRDHFINPDDGVCKNVT